VGMQGCLQALALAPAAAAVLLSLFAARARLAVAGLASALAMAALLAPAWDRLRLCAGVYFAPGSYVRDGRPAIDAALADRTLLYYAEGIDSTVSVTRTGGVRSFCVDGKVEASSSIEDMRLQTLQGQLPMLLAQSP